jgi:hypothetical protein
MAQEFCLVESASAQAPPMQWHRDQDVNRRWNDSCLEPQFGKQWREPTLAVKFPSMHEKCHLFVV